MYDMEYMETIDIQTREEIEEEQKEELLTRLIRQYGFEHTKVITFAWYMEKKDLKSCELAYNQLVRL